MRRRTRRPELLEEAPPGRRRLDRASVVEAALRLLDEVGLEGLTTRRLAERLGVRSSSLYWHFQDKEELLDLLADRIMSEVPIPPPALPWRERLERLLTGGRRCLRAHQDAARVLAGRPPRGPHWLAVADAAVRAVVDAGLPAEETGDALQVLVGYLMGFALDEAVQPGAPGDPGYEEFLRGLPSDRFPTLTRMAALLSHPDTDRQFGYGLAFLLDGLERRWQPGVP